MSTSRPPFPSADKREEARPAMDVLPSGTSAQLGQTRQRKHDEPPRPLGAFSNLVTNHWLDLAARLTSRKTMMLNGNNLTLAAVVFAARYGGSVDLDVAVLPQIERSSAALKQMIEKGASIYGVNTGFGGSADVRTNDHVGLQSALLKMLQCGILGNEDVNRLTEALTKAGDMTSLLHATAGPISHSSVNNDMPLSWIRGSMAVRVNSLCQGASGIAQEPIRVLIDLLAADIVPQVPYRGSISASGDLSPLSYIAGVMAGNPALKAYKNGRLLPADQALNEAGINRAHYGAKEGLAIVNGTAVSAAVGCLALHETLQLAALSQILTAMSVEAMGGSAESFDPFIADLRPHAGQVDSAKSIRGFLEHSQLTSNEIAAAGTLRQDRYSLRTVSQWLGPALEDLHLAYTQLATEINSVTDNPLIDTSRQKALSGGNFQARAVTAAMEKTRQACQVIGKMLFTQCTEMINPATNRGLPPNLVSDEPSQSFLFKGTDIMMAALTSELGFLSTPVNHIEHAEMGNQAINSMALVSARYTMEASDVLAQLIAAHLGAACQAIDLRVMQLQVLRQLRPSFDAAFASLLNAQTESLWQKFQEGMDNTSTADSHYRIRDAAKSLQQHLIDAMLASGQIHTMSLSELKALTDAFVQDAMQIYQSSRGEYMKRPDATMYLGEGSKAMYSFIRHRLAVPFMSEKSLADAKVAFGTAVQSPIYSAIRSGAFWPTVVECFQQADRATSPKSRL